MREQRGEEGSKEGVESKERGSGKEVKKRKEKWDRGE